ncbi:class I SAM-dependent methyltransferase [Synechococcus sp. CBW1004]|nr:class I SAM-dependent methyltransferase [Synechococcus sp. CBW1004]
MGIDVVIPDYRWTIGTPHTHAYLLQPLQQLLDDHPHSRQVLDLGCGNGALAQQLDQWGYRVVGVDPSASGITASRQRNPEMRFHQATATPAEIKALGLGPFDVVVSTEVVEHCYAPRLWAASAFAALRPGGLLIASTPYHGYLKNLTLAITGKLENHFTALWDGGHIKFWSRRTLSRLLQEAGFEVVAFRGAGRVPWLWKSMLIAARKPLV